MKRAGRREGEEEEERPEKGCLKERKEEGGGRTGADEVERTGRKEKEEDVIKPAWREKGRREEKEEG